MDSQNRLLIAVVLSVLVLLVFQKLYIAPHAKRMQQQRAKEVAENRIITVSSEKEKPKVLPVAQTNIAISEKTNFIENDVFKIELTNHGARVKQIQLKKFKDTTTDKPIQLLDPKVAEEIITGPFLLQDLFIETPELKAWELIDRTETAVKYSLKTPAGILITKEIFLHNSNYIIGLRLNIENKTPTPMPVKYKLVGPSSLFSKPGIDERFVGADVKIGQEIKRLGPRPKELRAGGKVYYDSPSWVSIRGRYFSLALEPRQEEQACFIEKEAKTRTRSGVIIGPVTIKPNNAIAKEFLLYAGPNDMDEIAKATPGMEGVVSFGKLAPITIILLKLLKFFNSIVHNYGVSIIMLTLVVTGILFPLTRKSLKSMKEMQAIQPEVERLRREYKNNPQKLNKETMELYKKHKINPLGGCLPMFFQMPIFIALYLALMKSVELKGANFLWIKDLSEPDAAFKLPAALPVLGEYINILPILMVIAMFLQQKTSQPATTQTEQQKMMAIMMPFLFGFIFYNMPSGFVLYWLTYTTIMIIMQEFVLKIRHTTPKLA